VKLTLTDDAGVPYAEWESIDGGLWTETDDSQFTSATDPEIIKVVDKCITELRVNP